MTITPISQSNLCLLPILLPVAPLKSVQLFPKKEYFFLYFANKRNRNTITSLCFAIQTENNRILCTCSLRWSSFFYAIGHNHKVKYILRFLFLFITSSVMCFYYDSVKPVQQMPNELPKLNNHPVVWK